MKGTPLVGVGVHGAAQAREDGQLRAQVLALSPHAARQPRGVDWGLTCRRPRQHAGQHGRVKEGAPFLGWQQFRYWPLRKRAPRLDLHDPAAHQEGEAQLVLGEQCHRYLLCGPQGERESKSIK